MSKVMAALENKEAIVKLMAIHALKQYHSPKKIYKDIELFRAEIKARLDAGMVPTDPDIVVFRNEIKKRRAQLRERVDQMYTFKVYLKRYKQGCNVEIVYSPSKEETYAKFIKKTIDEAKHKIRASMKQKESFPRMWGGAGVVTVFTGSKDKGYTFADEGSVLKVHVQKNMKQLSSGKVPTTLRRYIGIELEFCAPIKEEKFALKLFQNGIHKFAQLKPDGSLRPKPDLKEVGFELAILLEETNYKKDLKKLTDLLAAIGAIAKDRRCGLHVHVDMRRRDKDLVYNNLVACQYALLSIVDPNRYNNEFCRVVKSRDFPTEFTGAREERYKTINAAAYYKYRTLEVRMHEGTVDFKEISNWVDLLVKVVNYPKRLKDNVVKLPTLKKRMKLTDRLYEYALERSCVFGIQNNPHSRDMREDAEVLMRPGQARPRRPMQAEARPVMADDLIFRNHFARMAEQAPPQQPIIPRAEFVGDAMAQAAVGRFVERLDVDGRIVMAQEAAPMGAVLGGIVNNNIIFDDINPLDMMAEPGDNEEDN